jgi:hypothetical protein
MGVVYGDWALSDVKDRVGLVVVLQYPLGSMAIQTCALTDRFKITWSVTAAVFLKLDQDK